MTNPDELERAVERVEKRWSEMRDCSVCDGYGKVQRHEHPYGQRDCGGCDATGERHVIDQPFRADLRLILSANREMRASLKRIAYAEADGLDLARDSMVLERAIKIARSALTTQRGGK